MAVEYTIRRLFAFLSLLVVHKVITCYFNFITQITGICEHCGILKILKYFQVAKFNARCWWRSWLRHCATSRKVVGSIPNCVIGFFY